MEEKTRIQSEFIPGQGHLVREVPIDSPLTNGTVQVLAGLPQPPAAPVMVANLEEHLEKLGLVAVPRDDYNEILERVRELELQLDHAAKGGEVPPSPPTAAARKAKKGEDARPLEERIAAAASLEELTDLMKTVDDKALLALADARADELKQGGGQ